MISETPPLHQHLHATHLPNAAVRVLLDDTIGRDRTTARRNILLNILWCERFLTRKGLVARVEGELGNGCFGGSAWEDTFYRDMRVVKQAFRAAGYQLAYSRRKNRTGYYLRGEPHLHPGLARVVRGSLAEVDPAQIAIYRRLTPTDRFHQGCSISDTARRAVVFRLEQRGLNSSQAEAARLAGLGREG